jgi:hypothetical protein
VLKRISNAKSKRFASFASTMLCLSACTQPEQSVPDFTGNWVRNSLEFETPASGPGPLTNLERRTDGRPGPAKVGDYANAILRPAAAERVKALGDMARTGVVFPDPENQCMPWQVPNILRHFQVAILQQRDQVTLLYLQNHQVRRVRMNESHPTRIVPSSFGVSVGRYEGDTLVIDTVGIKAGPLSMIDWYGTPFSDALHVVERYRLIDYETAKVAVEAHEKQNRIPSDQFFVDPDYRGEGLQIEFTVDDPETFTMPWSGVVTYRRAGSAWVEDVCAENLRESVGPDRKVPTADVPDF